MASRRPTDSPTRSPEIPKVLKSEEKGPLAAPARKVTPPPRAKKLAVPPASRVAVSADARRAMIAEHAYLRAERRGFAAGDEEEDWLAAEAEVDALLRAGHGAAPQ